MRKSLHMAASGSRESLGKLLNLNNPPPTKTASILQRRASENEFQIPVEPGSQRSSDCAFVERARAQGRELSAMLVHAFGPIHMSKLFEFAIAAIINVIYSRLHNI